jgi:hypothetical protein
LTEKGISKTTVPKFGLQLGRKSGIPSAKKIVTPINWNHRDGKNSQRRVSIQAGVSPPSMLINDSSLLLTPMALKSRRDLNPNNLSKDSSLCQSKRFSDAAPGQELTDNDYESIGVSSERPMGLRKSSSFLNPDQDLKISRLEDHAMIDKEAEKNAKETRKIGFAKIDKVFEFQKFKSTSPVAKQLFLG